MPQYDKKLRKPVPSEKLFKRPSKKTLCLYGLIGLLICSIPVLLHDTIGTRMNDKFLIYLNPKLGFKILYPFGWDVLVENPNRVMKEIFSALCENTPHGEIIIA